MTRVKAFALGTAFKHARGLDGMDQATSENLAGNNFNMIIEPDTLREGQDRREIQNKLVVEFKRHY